MIAVYLQPDSTQVLIAKQKNKSLQIQSCKVINQGYLQLFSSGADLEELECFFEDIKSVSQRPHDEIYLVLPDYTFAMINCFASNDSEQTKAEISTRLDRNISELYYSEPIWTSPEVQKPLVTACAFDKKIIDCIIEAADNVKAHLLSIEPASIAFLRTKIAYNQEELMLFLFSDKATLVAYSQLGGLFKLDNNDLSINNLANMSKASAEEVLSDAMSEFEMAANSTFDYLNRDLKYTIFASSTVVNSFDTLSKRNAANKLFPDQFVINDIVPEYEQQNWLCAVGTLLQYIDFSTAEFEESIDSYETAVTANILPSVVQKQSKKLHRIQQLYKAAKLAIACMLIVSLVESFIIMFFSSTQIPQGLEDDYQSGQETISRIENELSIISLEQQEDQHPLLVYNAISQSRPKEIGFVSLEIGSDSKTNPSEWVKIKMLAADPLKFQNYIHDLSGNEIFGALSIPQITSDNNTGAKIANMVLGKKGGQ